MKRSKRGAKVAGGMKRGRQDKGKRRKISVNDDDDGPMSKKDIASFVDHLKEHDFEGDDLDEEAWKERGKGEVVHVPKKYRWRKVNVTDGFMTGMKNSGFVELEEMDESDYMNMVMEKVDQDEKKKKSESEGEEEEEEEKEHSEEEEGEKEEEQSEEEEEKPKKKLRGKPLPAQPFADTPEEIEKVNSVKDAWSHFSLCTKVLAGVRSLNFAKPTPVQERVLQAAIGAGRDIIAAAETGSGKTLAYAIPVVNAVVQAKLDAGSTANTSMKALILTPTRELALQVAEHIRRFTGGLPVRVAAVVGGMSMQKQERILRMCPDIVVATTGRLWELISDQSNEYLGNVADLQSFVLDEADRMIEVGHFRELDEINKLIHARCTRKLQTFVLSATLAVSTRSHRLLQKEEPGQRADQAQTRGRDRGRGKKGDRGKKAPAHPTRDDFETPLDQVLAAVDFRRRVEVIDLTTVHVTVEGLHEYQLLCRNEEKDAYLYWVLRTVTTVPALSGRSIVFTNAISMTKRLVSLLRLLRVPVARLHAGMQQRQRLRALDYFRGHDTCVLVASDVAARGPDSPEVAYDVHYGVPRTADIYVHRAGRTARAGHRGISICLVGPDEVPHFRALCNQMGKDAMPKFKGPESLAVLARNPEKVPSDKNVVPFSRIAPLMATAHTLDNELRLAAADARKKSWVVFMAKGMLDDDDDDDDDDEEEEEEEEKKEKGDEKSSEEEEEEEEEQKKGKKNKKGRRTDAIDKLSVDKELADMKLVMRALGEDDDDDEDLQPKGKRKKVGRVSGLVAPDDDDAVAERRATLQSWKLMVAELKEKLARQLAEVSAPALCSALQTVSGTGGFGNRAVPIGSGLDLGTLEEAIANARARHAALGKLESKHQAKYGSKSKKAALLRPELNPKIRPRASYNKHMRRRLMKMI